MINRYIYIYRTFLYIFETMLLVIHMAFPYIFEMRAMFIQYIFNILLDKPFTTYFMPHCDSYSQFNINKSYILTLDDIVYK